MTPRQKKKLAAIMAIAIAWALIWYACGKRSGGGAAGGAGDSAVIVQQVQSNGREAALARQEVAQLRAEVAASLQQLQRGQNQNSGSAGGTSEIASLRGELEALKQQVKKIEAATPELMQGAAEGPPPTYNRAANPKVPGQTANGIRVDFLECRRSGQQLEVDFQLLNITRNDFSIWMDHRTSIQDHNGMATENVGYLVDGENQREPHHRLAAGLPVKATAFFSTGAPEGNVLPYFNVLLDGDKHRNEYTFRDMPIKDQ